MTKVLIVDDEPDVRSLVRSSLALARQDMTAIEAADGDEALSMIYTDRPDLVVLDLALPRRDGFSVLEQVRQKTDLPIIVLTARGLEEDKIKGLQLGADDYLTKPFSPGELVARIESVLRRSVPRERKSGVVETHDLVLDLAARRVRRGGKDIHFTPTEFNLLAELATHPGEALTHETLLTRVWGTEYRYETLGAGLRLGHPFFEYWRWSLGYRASQDRISDLSDVAALSTALLEERGTHVTSAMSGSVGRDSRDNVIAPTKGGQGALAAQFAGLGGTERYVKTSAFITQFVPIWFDHVLSGRLEGDYGFGWSDKPMPLFERFYLGGPNSIRSFKFMQISPVDDNGVRVGGTSEVLANAEYLIPLPFGLRLAGFYDVGNVYGSGTSFDLTSLKQGVGGGVRWQSPFGPIRVDYGINPNRKPGESFGAFQFSVGSPF